MPDYLPRLVDTELDELIPDLPAIALDGPKGIGKTETCSRRARTRLRLDDPAAASTLRADPQRLTRLEPPVLVDEWQNVPPVWDVVRRAVDDGARPGSFLLTGSATPARDQPVHSGAGRIVSLRMRPLTLTERPGMPAPTVSLRDLLNGDCTPEGRSDLTLENYVEEITRSGLPAIHPLSPRARRQQLDGYITRLFDRELSDGQAAMRRAASMREWLTAYAAATSTTASFEAIRAAATPGQADPPSRVTAERYRDWLASLWLLDPLPAWRPGGSPLQRLTAGPKHHLADPALAARLLDVGPSDLLDGAGRTIRDHGTLLGALFESLATLCVRVLAQTIEARVSHLRTHRGEREVDLIVQGPAGRVVGIEVKLSSTVSDTDVKHLLWLKSQLRDQVSDTVILTTGPDAYRRNDSVAVVPLALLGP
ncbi:MAG: DUF4143 domain-containing protein [Propionibacteriaceae bacterium]|nr:DUF4143 domain-containing protein [Propionibacteriaceae bacterium]